MTETVRQAINSEHVKNLIRAVVPRQVRNFVRSPSRSADWVFDWTKFSLGVTNLLPLAPDWSLVCHPYAYRAAQGLVVDPAQIEEFRGFLSCCRNKMLLFDIGAHFGFFSLAAAHYGGKSIALEPSPMANRMIAVQAALNGCAPDIRILCAAASDKSGSVGMLSAGMFSYGFFKVAKGRRDVSRVAAVTIDDLSQQFGPPTHIKIDVEGYEGAVLRGAKATLKAHAPLLFLELHNDILRIEGGDPNSVVDELIDAGYSAFTYGGQELKGSSLVAAALIRVLCRRR